MGRGIKMKIGDRVKCINTEGIPNMFKLKVGKIYVIREIGDRTGGLRLEGKVLYSDLTGYEKCYARNRFLKIN